MNRLTAKEAIKKDITFNSSFSLQLAEMCFIRLKKIEDILGEEYDLDRLKDLIQADEEGRCLIITAEQKSFAEQMAKNGML